MQIDKNKINQRFFNEAKKTEVSVKVKEFMAPFVPREEGELMDSARAKGNAIVYDVPYAKKMYYGDNLNFSKEKNMLATSHWDRAMIIAKGEVLSREIERIVKK